MKVIGKLLMLAVLLGTSVLLFSCDIESTARNSGRTGGDDQEDDGSTWSAPSFVISGSAIADSASDLVTVHLNPIVDQQGDILTTLDKNSFKVSEDGVARDFFVASGKSKPWTLSNYKVLYDRTESMIDSETGGFYGFQSFFDLDSCNALQYPYTQLVLFGDRSSDRQIFPSAWWSEDLYNGMIETIADSDFLPDDAAAENPLETVMALWNDPSKWNDGYQRTFLLVTDAPMHQAGDGDSESDSAYSLSDVCRALQDSAAPAKGVVHVVSPAVQNGEDGRLEYWNDRAKAWEADDADGHANPADLAACTGGTWTELKETETPSGSTETDPMDDNFTVTFSSSDLSASHDLVVQVRLETGDVGRLVFSGIRYPTIVDQPASMRDCFPTSCAAIRDSGVRTSGYYWVDPDGSAGSLLPVQVYCDLTALGGWTLVLLSNSFPSNGVAPNWTQATTGITFNGPPYDIGFNYDMLVGLKYWNSFGNIMRADQGNTRNNPLHEARFTFAAFNPSDDYRLVLSNYTLTVGNVTPGLYGSHNNKTFSTYDHGVSSGCASSFGKTPWWYTSCWSGNFWGNGYPPMGGPYFDGPHWTGASTDYHYYGEIWIGNEPTSCPDGSTHHNCEEILAAHPSSGDGLYCVDPDGAGGLAPAEVWCDMTFDGGGWTLVLLNNATTMPYGISANWNQSINHVTVKGNPFSLDGSDVLVGLAYWNYFGTTLRAEQGTSASAIEHRAVYSSFSLNTSNFYQLQLAGETVLLGGTSPGLYVTHNTMKWSTYDKDNDATTSTVCGTSYTHAPWWYRSCWDGSFWGGGGTTSYLDKPNWTGAGTSTAPGETHAFGAIYIR